MSVDVFRSEASGVLSDVNRVLNLLALFLLLCLSAGCDRQAVSPPQPCPLAVISSFTNEIHQLDADRTIILIDDPLYAALAETLSAALGQRVPLLVAPESLGASPLPDSVTALTAADVAVAVRHAIVRCGKQDLGKPERNHLCQMHKTSILTRLFFDANKVNHVFHVSGNVVQPWMFAFLQPDGLTLCLAEAPLPCLPEPAIEKDFAFWNELSTCLDNDPDTLGARRIFSRMRSAIAGVYVFWERYQLAEQALRQAIRIDPDTVIGCFRLGELYLRMERFSDARYCVSQINDPSEKENVASFQDRVSQYEEWFGRLAVLKRDLEDTRSIELQPALELVNLCGTLGKKRYFEAVVEKVLLQNIPVDAFQYVTKMCVEGGRSDFMVAACQRRIDVKGPSEDALLNLAAAYLAVPSEKQAFRALEDVIAFSGDAPRAKVCKDPRFAVLSGSQEFRSRGQRGCISTDDPGDP